MGSDRRDIPPHRTAASNAAGRRAVPGQRVPDRTMSNQTGANRAKPGTRATKRSPRSPQPQQPASAPLLPRPAIAPAKGRRSPLATLGAIALIALAGGGVAWCGWLGVQLIVNPQSQLWMNRFLPGWIPQPVTGLKPPQTLAQIRTAVGLAGRTLGEPMALGKNKSLLDGTSTVTDWLMPILERSPVKENFKIW